MNKGGSNKQGAESQRSLCTADDAPTAAPTAAAVPTPEQVAVHLRSLSQTHNHIVAVVETAKQLQRRMAEVSTDWQVSLTHDVVVATTGNTSDAAIPSLDASSSASSTSPFRTPAGSPLCGAQLIEHEVRRCEQLVDRVEAIRGLLAVVESLKDERTRMASGVAAARARFVGAAEQARRQFDALLAAEQQRFDEASELGVAIFAALEAAEVAATEELRSQDKARCAAIASFADSRCIRFVQLLRQKQQDLWELEERQARLDRFDPALDNVDSQKRAFVEEGAVLWAHVRRLRELAVAVEPCDASGVAMDSRCGQAGVDMSDVPRVEMDTQRPKRNRDTPEAPASVAPVADSEDTFRPIELIARGIGYWWAHHMRPRDSCEASATASGSRPPLSRPASDPGMEVEAKTAVAIDVDALDDDEPLPHKAGRADEFAVPPAAGGQELDPFMPMAEVHGRTTFSPFSSAARDTAVAAPVAGDPRRRLNEQRNTWRQLRGAPSSRDVSPSRRAELVALMSAEPITRTRNVEGSRSTNFSAISGFTLGSGSDPALRPSERGRESDLSVYSLSSLAGDS